VLHKADDAPLEVKIILLLGPVVDELDAQWYDYPGYWDRIHKMVEPIDRLIEAFNERVGLL